MPSIFLSYSHHDKPFVSRLAHDLRAQGITVWLDENELKVGESLLHRISDAIHEMDYFGAVLSNRSVKSRWVQFELQQAMNKQLNSSGVNVLPIRLEECPLPRFLEGLIYADFVDMRGYEKSLELLARSINGEFTTLSEFEKARKRLELSDDSTQEMREFVDVAEGLPFSRLWMQAVRMNAFTMQFKTQMLDTLAEIAGKTGPYYAMYFVSFLNFTRELERRGPLHPGAASILIGVAEDSRIEPMYSKMALEALVEARHKRGQSTVELPSVFGLAVGDTLRPLARELLDSLFVGTYRDSTLQLLDGYLESSPSKVREEFLCASALYCLGDYPAAAERLREIGTGSFSSARQFLVAIRSAVVEDSSALVCYRAILAERVNTESLDTLGRAAKDATRAVEGGDTRPLGAVLELLTKDGIERLRSVQGDEFSFRLLMNLVIDAEVDSSVSTMALLCIAHEFEPDAIFLCEGVPDVLFLPKAAGMFRLSVMEGLCEAGDWDSRTNYTIFNILAHMINFYELQRDSQCLAKIAALLEATSTESVKARALYRWAKGDIDHDAAVRLLKEWEKTAAPDVESGTSRAPGSSRKRATPGSRKRKAGKSADPGETGQSPMS